MSARKYLLLCLLLVQTLPVQAGDPTRPPFAEAATPLQETSTPLQLSMILREDGRRRAVINGQLLAVSEAVGNARVVAINEDYVVMAQGGRRFNLSLPITPVKQTHQGGLHE